MATLHKIATTPETFQGKIGEKIEDQWGNYLLVLADGVAFFHDAERVVFLCHPPYDIPTLESSVAGLTTAAKAKGKGLEFMKALNIWQTILASAPIGRKR